MSRFRCLFSLAVLGCVAPWMSCASAPPPESKEPSPRDADIRWFLDTAKQAAATIEDPMFRECQYSFIVEAQAKAGDFSGAMKTAGLIKDLSWKASAYTDIAEAQAKAGDFSAAMKTAGLMGVAGRTYAYCRIAQAAAKAGNAAAANEASKSAQQAAGLILFISDAFYSGEPTEGLRADIAAAQAWAGDLAGAERTAAAIRDANSRADAHRLIAEAQAGAGDYWGAMRRAAAIEVAWQKDYAYLGIGIPQVRAGDFERALRTADTCEEDYNKANLYARTAVAQARTGDFASAMKTAAAIEDVQVARRWKAWAYCSIAEAEIEAGNEESAKETIELAKPPAAGVKDLGDRALAYGQIATVQAEAHDLAGAMATAGGIVYAPWRAWACCQIAEVEAKAEDSEAFKKAIDLAREAAATVTDAGMKDCAYRGIAQTQVRCGEVEKVRA